MKVAWLAGLAAAILLGTGVWALAVWRAERRTPPHAASATLTITYPQAGTLFPPDFAPPTFLWEAGPPAPSRWKITVRLEGEAPVEMECPAPSWTPDETLWARIQAASVGKDAEVLITASAVGQASVRFRTSADPVGAPLFYREVVLPFAEAVKDPSRLRWRLGPVSSRQPPPIVLQGLPVCGNCHSFSKDGRALGMDVDYANDKGSYVITPVEPETRLTKEKIITWSDFRREDGELTFGLLSQVSPDGRYVVSTVKDRSIFIARDDLAFSQLFFPIKGLLVVHDREKKTFRPLPGADDPRFVQSSASWSPDGKYIYFSRAPAHDLKNLKHPELALLTQQEAAEFFKEHPTVCYDIWRVPFNGGAGGTPEPLAGAGGDGMSNFFPRCSPDGKWVVFCKARSFMLLQGDSQLYIVPAGGGAARRLRCNTARMNSWHSWSPNGRWLVFSSKARTPYTQLMLTHIDEQGKDSPAVVLDRLTAPDRAANIPEFVALPPEGLAQIREQFMDDLNYVRAGTDLFRGGDNEKAIAQFRKALELNPGNALAHFCLGSALASQRDMEAASAEFRRAVELDPSHERYHVNLGRALRELGRAEEAETALREAVRLHPRSAPALAELGKALCEREHLADGLTFLEQAVALAPEDYETRYSLAAALFRAKRTPEALREGARALEQARAAGRKVQAAEIERALEAMKAGEKQ